MMKYKWWQLSQKFFYRNRGLILNEVNTDTLEQLVRIYGVLLLIIWKYTEFVTIFRDFHFAEDSGFQIKIPDSIWDSK